MNRRQKIIISVTGIFLVLLILVGLTYAYFLTQIQGNEEEKSITVTTANLRLVYDNGDGTVITGDKIEPGYPLVPKTFTVTNEGNANITYGVYLIDVINTFERKEDITYTLTCKNEDNTDCNNVTESVTFPSGIAEMVQNEIEPNKTQTYTLAVTYKETGTDQSVDMNKTLQAKVQIFGENSKGVILPYSTNTLAYNIINKAMTLTEEEKANFYAEYKSTPDTLVAQQISETVQEQGYEDEYVGGQNIYQDYILDYYWTYSTEYKINQTTGKFSLVNPKTCKYSESGCISDLVNSGEKIYIASDSYTKVAKSSNSLSTYTNLDNVYRLVEVLTPTSKYYKWKRITNMPESTLSITEDDYGNSYYYRGAIRNNYLEINNICWRIVRIEGDGSIKLTLAAKKKCNAITSYGGGDGLITVSNSQGYRNEYVINSSGLVSTNKKYIMDYVNGDNHGHNNSARVELEEWFNSSGLDLTKLKDEEWCLGNQYNAYDENGQLLTIPINDLMYDESTFYYDTNKRIYGRGETANATLKCKSINYKTYNSKIGMLTVDEVVFAGTKVETYNYSYYLIENAMGGYGYHTLSPSYFSINNDRNFFVSPSNGAISSANLGSGSSIRPTISLLPNTQIDGGDGTITNPYTIK